MKKYIFTQEEKQQVKAAIQKLEKVSSGEVVPFFVRKSDDYNEACWFLALIMSIASIGILALLSYTWMLPETNYVESFILILSITVLGFILPMIFPRLKRILISKERALQMVTLRATEAFLNEKVYETKEHIGILIFISRLEHIVLIIGDEGINKKVHTKDWEEVVKAITDGLRRNEIGNGLVNGIKKCEELLLNNGFNRKATDTNELSDELRIDDN